MGKWKMFQTTNQTLKKNKNIQIHANLRYQIIRIDVQNNRAIYNPPYISQLHSTSHLQKGELSSAI